MDTVFALLCFVVVIHWLIFPYPSGLLHWHCGNLTIAPVPAKQPWWIWINTSCEFIMNDCITTTKQSTTKPCAYFLGYTVIGLWSVEALRLGIEIMYIVLKLHRRFGDPAAEQSGQTLISSFSNQICWSYEKKNCVIWLNLLSSWKVFHIELWVWYFQTYQIWIIIIVMGYVIVKSTTQPCFGNCVSWYTWIICIVSRNIIKSD